MYIPRTISTSAKELARQYPVVTITEPRQSVKTINADYFKGFKHFEKVIPDLPYGRMLVYGGQQIQKRNDIVITNIWDLENQIDTIHEK